MVFGCITYLEKESVVFSCTCFSWVFQEPVISPSLGPIVPLLLVFVLCRICRTWNQTGDKWSYLPDVGDWLVM